MEPAAALSLYAAAIDNHAPGFLEGLYVVGSYALGDWQPGRSDLDVVNVTAEPATDDDVERLRTALTALGVDVPDLDGPFVAWSDLTIAPATGLHRPWTLGRQLHHDGECFEINPVTWYTLDLYGVAVRGPAVRHLGVFVDDEARLRFVIDNLETYWAAVADDVTRACAAGDRRFEADSLEWCVLGALRLHFSAFTGDVTSKRGAGEYGVEIVPAALRGVVRHALAVRAGTDLQPVDGPEMVAAAEVIRWAIDEARRAAA